MKIAPKTAILCVALACIPLTVMLSLFLPRYGAAVRETEQRRQFELAQSAGAVVLHHIDQVASDARAVGEATNYLAEVPADGREAAYGAVQAVLATRQSIAVVRIEIPQENISVAFAKSGNDKSDAPESTPELRTAAESNPHGFALDIIDRRHGRIVAPVRLRNDPSKRVYVVAPVYFEPLAADLRDLVDTRGMTQGENLLVLDPSARVVAGQGDWGRTAGDDASDLPIVRTIAGSDPKQRLAIQEDFNDGDRTWMYSVVTIDRVGEQIASGWTVVLARPHEVAFAGLYSIRRTLIGIAVVTALLSAVFAAIAARGVVEPILAVERRARLLGQKAWAKIGKPSTRTDEIGELDRAIVGAGADLEKSEHELAREIKHRVDLSRFIAPEVVEAILSGQHKLDLGGQRRLITVLFADIVAFTPLSESRRPEEVVAILNDVFTVLSEVVFRHAGVVDKFVGDSIMAIWGAPFEQPDHAQRALLAAGDMMRFLENTSEQLRLEHDVEIRLAIAVNSGEVVVGNIGSARRMEFTAIGDAVNVAARLEAIARPGQVLVGERTAELAGAEFQLRDLGRRKIAGRAAEVLVFELEAN